MLAAAVTLVGCTTTSSGKRVIDPAKISQLAPALETSVAGAVVYAYSKDKNSVKYIAVVKTALQEFLVSTNLSPSALQATIYNLPVKELKTAEAQLIITPILAAYKAYGEQYVQSGIAENEGLKVLVRALVNGVDSGLQGVAQINSSP